MSGLFSGCSPPPLPNMAALWAAAWAVAWAAACAAAVVAAALAALVARWRAALARARRQRTTSVVVLVLGDLGRSPRMQYHVCSLAGTVPFVDVVAYRGSSPLKSILERDNVALHFIPTPPAIPAGSPRAVFLLYAPVKVVLQSISLLWLLLFRTRAPSHVLVQNPPAIPTLTIAWLVCRLRGAAFVVDWHNYGFSILQLTLGDPAHWLVRLARSIEHAFGGLADESLCVTHAMKDDLRDHWGVRARALHDRPHERFRPTTIEEQHELFSRLGSDKDLAPCFAEFDTEGQPRGAGRTLFTELAGDGVRLRADRPALVLSSTSWTEDEDFGILLEALKGYERECRARDGASRPRRVVCIITGKGPQREMYERQIAEMDFRFVRICTMFLSNTDYARILGSGDFAVSLHTSSSNLDLPMKVVDMFGCALPVCAKNFQCLGELVHHDVNGLVFDTPRQLQAQIQTLLDSPRTVARMRAQLQGFRDDGWAQNWDGVARSIFVGDDKTK